MANKDYGPKDYGGTQSLSSILAGKGIVAKPGVSSGGNKATQRAQQFAAGKTYTPAPSKNLVAGNPQMRTSVGPGGQVGLSPARASMGFPNSAPPTSIGAPMQSRGAPSPMASGGGGNFLQGLLGGGGQSQAQSYQGPARDFSAQQMPQAQQGYQADPIGVLKAFQPPPMQPQTGAWGDGNRWGSSPLASMQAPTEKPAWMSMSLWALYGLDRLQGGK